MAKAQGKKAAAKGSKGAAKKVAARVKKAAGAAKKKPVPKKAAPAKKPAAKKPAPKKPGPKKPAPKPAAKKLAPKVKAAAKPMKKAAKAVAKAVKTAAKKVVAKVAPKKPAPKPTPKAAPKAAPKAVKPAPAAAPVAPAVPAVPKPAPVPEAEKKRGRRARPRVLSNGAPAASWLSSEKPRPASFIAAPARAEAPSAVAAPPASSDRLIRAEDLAHPAVRTVPVRIDVEQGAGRFYVIANPMEVSVRVSEGIEWDFRYIGGADVNVEEVVIEFDKPSPFSQSVFKTHKPGGARPHRQLSGGALPSAAGKRVPYTVRALNQFKTELANTKVYVNVTS